jgi:hypothetical protein
MSQAWFVNKASASSTSSLTVTPNKPVDTQARDLMLAMIFYENNAPIMESAPSEWNQLIDVTVGARAIRMAVYWKIAGDSEPSSYTWTLSAAREIIGIIATYRGVNQANPIGNYSYSTSTLSSTMGTAPSINIQHLGNVAIHMAGIAYGTTWTPPSAGTGWTEREDIRTNTTSTNIAAEMSEKQGLAVGATGNITAVSSSADYRIAAMVEIRSDYISAAGAISTGEGVGTPGKVLGKILAAGAIASLMAFGTASVQQILKPWGNIESAEAFGTTKINGAVVPGGIGSAQAIGSCALYTRANVKPDAIPSGEAFGSSQLNYSLLSVGGVASAESVGSHALAADKKLCGDIRTREAFGTPSVLPVSPTDILGVGNISTAESFGSSKVVCILLPSGLASAEAFGFLQMKTGKDLCGAIPSAEAFGEPEIVALLATKIYPPGIVSGQAFGTASVLAVGSNLYPTGIPTAEAIGSPKVGLPRKLCGAIGSLEAVGIPEVSVSAPGIHDAGGIASAEAVGAPAISGPIIPTGIASSEAFGYTWVYEVNYCGNIESAEAFGSVSVVSKSSSAIHSITGISSSEGIGTPRIGGTIRTAVIATGYLSGVTNIVGTILSAGQIANPSAYGFAKISGTINPSGIPSGEGFEEFNKLNPVIAGAITGAGGIKSEQVFGTPSLLKRISLLGLGIESAEAFGTADLQVGNIRMLSIDGEEAFGTAKINGEIRGISGIATAEAIGTPLVQVYVYSVPDHLVLNLVSSVCLEINLESGVTTEIDLYSGRID